jgi:hypothetical protein
MRLSCLVAEPLDQIAMDFRKKCRGPDPAAGAMI